MTSENHGVPARRGPLPRLLLLLLVGAALIPRATAAVCVFDAQQARSNYDLGRHDLVLETILECLVAEALSGQELIDAYEYLAKAYVALDEFGEAEETVRMLIQRDPAFNPASGDPPFFRRMVDAAKHGDRTVVISSVSKNQESLREAPATVVVVTAEQILRRGYLDLEAVLHDLPGFDISRGNGTIYSNFYQRGYRSDNNDRTLFLVDGVENNDVWSNVAYLSRQYPLSNIERVEVVYGPASTMYGPNAFVGVINVITRSPESWLDEGQNMILEAQVGGGEWETRWLDATLAGRAASGNIIYSLTGRIYESDEMDLSPYDDWDFDSGDYDRITDEAYGNALNKSIVGLDAVELSLIEESPFTQIENGMAVLTEDGLAEARRQDKTAYDLPLNGSLPEFSNRTDDWSVYAKLRFFGVDLGFQTWSRQEGISGWYHDNNRAGSDQGNSWTPELSFAYLKYDRSFGKLGLRIFSQFLTQEVAEGSGVNQVRNYSNGRLSILDLASGQQPFWEETRFRESSRQFRTEANFVYTRSPRFNLVSGIEVRSSFLQGNYFLSSRPTAPDDLLQELIDARTKRDTDGEFFDQLDLGLFGQATFKVNDDWKFVVGGRVDNNAVDATAGAVVVEAPDGTLQEFEDFGYGSVFNPRVAAIYSPGPFVFKAIYAEAFKDASNLNRYALSPGTRDAPSPDLEPEKVRNVELAASWQVNDDLHVDLAAYRSDYSDAVALGTFTFADGSTTGQNVSAGALETLGIQSTLRYSSNGYDLWANYTYTDPRSTPVDRDGNELAEVRVGDIADHRFNLGGNAKFGDHLNFNLRLNWVGDRETGEGTSVSGSRFDVIDSYTVVNGAFSYKQILPGLDLQLIINNLLDEEYYHPGVRSAGGGFASRAPQNARAVFLRGVYGF